MDDKEQAWEKLRRDVERMQGMQATIEQSIAMSTQSLEARVLRTERDVADIRTTVAKEHGTISAALNAISKTYDSLISDVDFHIIRVLTICNTVLIVVFGAVALFLQMVRR